MDKYRGPEAEATPGAEATPEDAAAPATDATAEPGWTAADRRIRRGLWAFAGAVVGLALATELGFWQVVGLGFFYVLLPAIGWAQLPLVRTAQVERLPVYAASGATTLILGVGALGLGLGLGSGEAPSLGLVGLRAGELLVWSAASTVVGIAIIVAFEPLDRRISSSGTELVLQLIPRTGREKAAFSGLSVAAGVGEELAYRGYALHAIQLLGVAPWGAAVLSSVPFALLHAYQGSVGVVRTALIGFALAATVLATGSLFPAMLAHALIDVAAGLLIGPWLLRRSQASPGDPGGVAGP